MKADPEVLRGLLERISTTDRPDRGIDAALWYALVEKPQPGDKIDRDMIGRMPRYTASLDEALELAEHIQPKEWPDVLRNAVSHLGRHHHWHICFPRRGQRNELPLAIVRAALISALAQPDPSQEPGTGGERDA